MFFINFVLYFIAGNGMNWEKVVSNVFSNSISGFIEGGIYAAIITTIVFIILDHTNALKNRQKEWKLSSLPTPPSKNDKPLNKVETLFSLLFRALFGGLIIYLFANHSKIFGWFEIDANNSLNLVSQMFSNNLLKFIPAMITVLVVQLLTKGFILSQNFKNIKTHIARLVERVSAFVLMIVFFSTKSIINPAFYGEVATKLNVAESIVKSNVLLNMQILTIVGYVGLAASIAYFGYNLYIHYKNNKTM